MKRIFYSTMLAALLHSTSSYALFCPKNFNIINIGDSIESVELKCGKPSKVSKTEAPDSSPQQWGYYIPTTVNNSATQKTKGTIKTNFTFDKDGKAINISVNGIGVGSSSICGGNISLGSTREQVEKACGKPEFINKAESESKPSTNTASGPAASKNKEDDKNKIIKYTYDSNPPVTLIFKKGRLSSSQ